MPDEPRWPNEVTATDVVRLPRRIVWAYGVLLAVIAASVLWVVWEVRNVRDEIVFVTERGPR